MAASTVSAAAAPLELRDGGAFTAWLSSIDTFLFDCDGVLWRGGVGVPNVGATIAKLEAAGKRCYFVTNNSTKTRDEYVKVLANVAGISATKDAVLSSAYAAAVYCRDAGISKKAYVIGGSGLISELRDVAGLECVGPDDAAKTFTFGVNKPENLDPDVEAVVIGFDARSVFIMKPLCIRNEDKFYAFYRVRFTP
jgi:HAD superfamily hydrolase (TIGR01450 family)